MIREKIRAELPTLLKLYRADKFLVNKIVASAERLLRGGAQRSQASVPRRVRPHGADASSTGSAPTRPMPAASTA